jgi:transglutaminase-like putative cysteine protease
MISPDRLLEILILAIATVATLPLYPNLDPLAMTILPVAAIAGIQIRRKGSAIPPVLLTLTALALLLYYASRFSLANVAQPTAGLLSSFLAVRIAGERTGRAMLQTCALALFCLAASTLFSLGPLFLISLLFLSLLVIATLVILTFYENSPKTLLNSRLLSSLARFILILAGAALPLMAIFFLILPRTNQPLWNAFAPKSFATGGMSDRIEPGRAPSIEGSGRVAFRVTSPPLENEALYWRGTVFNRYTSSAWVRRTPPLREINRPGKGEKIRQIFMPEPGKLSVLVALDHPVDIRGIRMQTSGDLVSRPSLSAVTRNRYEAFSIPGDVLTVSSTLDRRSYLEIPDDIPPRIAASAREIAAKGYNDRHKLDLAEQLFKTLRLRYATTNLPSGKDSLDRFLFETRQGHCEFFASSFALMMRAAGVPSRVVGGYHGGIYNHLAGYYVVTDDMAHAWTEVYIDGKGWLRIDPSRWADGFDEIIINRSTGTGTSFSTVFDTFVYYWDVAVITYDLDKQLQMAQNASDILGMKEKLQTVRTHIVWFLAIASAAMIVVVVVRRRSVSPEQRILRQFLALAGARKGAPEGMGVIGIAAQTNNPDLIRFAEIYSRAIYCDKHLTPTDIRQLTMILSTVKKRKQR